MMLQPSQSCHARVRRLSHTHAHKLPWLASGIHHHRLRPRFSTSSDGREPASTVEVPLEKPIATPAPPLDPNPTPSSASTAPATPEAPTATSVTPPAVATLSPSASIVAEKKEAPKPKLRSFPVELSDDDMFGTKGLIQELTDQQKFGKRGEAWFFAQLLVCLLILFPPMELKGLLDLVGTLAISAGLVFLTYALFCLGRSLSPLPAPRQENKLVTSGMYGYVRHPMYGGLILVAIGMTLVTGSESRLALSLLLWWILEQKANVEEMLLEQLHPEYKAYKERVKKFIPYIY